jgi:hypothetical protein
MRDAISIDSQFSTGNGALFAATSAQLVEQLPGWRKPLPAPEKRSVVNPFTGVLIPNVMTRDPGPRAHPAIPSRLIFPCVLLPSREDWEQNYLALDLALSGEPPLSEALWDEGWLDVMLRRQLFEEPLFGGGDDVGDSRDLLRVPTRIVDRLVELRTDEVDGMARAWMARCWVRPDAPTEYLVQFCALAHLAVSIGAGLFSWNINPLHRDRSG